MRTRPLFFRLFWWLPLLAASPFPALPAQPAAYVYLHLGQEDGLASNHVLAVLQDRQGFVWLGTGNGLQRYDGRQFVHYRHQPGNPRSLPADIVESLLEDRAGNLWVAAGGHVSRFSPQDGQFVPVPQAIPSPAAGPGRYRLALDGDGRVWWVFHDGAAGLAYDTTRHAFVPAHPTPFRQLRSPGAAYREALAPFPSPEPYSVLEDSRGIVWAGGTQLLARYPGDTAFRVIPKRHTPRYGIDYSLIFCLAEDREGTLWVGTDQGLYRFNPDKGRFFTPAEAVAGGDDAGGVTGFLETGDGRVWVGTLRAGIRVYDARLRLLHCYRPTHGKTGPPMAAWGLVQDREGTVWAGVENGLLGITPGRQSIRTVHSPLLTGQTLLKGICDADGVLWWGTSGGHIVRWDGRQFSVLPLPPDVPARGRVQALLSGPADSLWVATAGGGIYQVHKRTGRVGDAYTATTRPGALLSNQVGSLQRLPEGTLLVSTSAGLHFIDPKTKRVRTRTTADGLPANAILNVVPDRDGSLFLTTQSSLFRWHAPTGRVETFGARDGLLDQSYAFSTAYRLRDGRVLLGT
ncbi:MAG: hypothetical protein ICV83_21030, partial [Cytophagales bacterium]|nr:hypothetical protein [Cytophagales bacterium]